DLCYRIIIKGRYVLQTVLAVCLLYDVLQQCDLGLGLWNQPGSIGGSRRKSSLHVRVGAWKNDGTRVPGQPTRRNIPAKQFRLLWCSGESSVQPGYTLRRRRPT
ncbi:unnamed protein product, partial [Ixodes pacificus]